MSAPWIDDVAPMVDMVKRYVHEDSAAINGLLRDLSERYFTTDADGYTIPARVELSIGGKGLVRLPA